MAKGITISLDGVDKLLRNIKSYSKDITDEVDSEIAASAEEMAQISKRLAPVNLGYLRNNISASRLGYLAMEFVSQAEYSPFLEFGTKTKVSIPKGLEGYANQFRGKKGKGSLLDNIRKWLKRKEKGLSKKELESKARYISYLIATKGIKPQPFFFRAYDAVKPKMINNIKAIINAKR